MNDQQPPPPATKKKEGIGKYIAIGGLGCLLLLGFIGAIVFVVFKLTGGPVKVVNQQLDALREGDREKAYSYCSTAFQQNTNFAAFSAFVDSNPILKNASAFSSANREISGGVAKLSGTLKGTDGASLPAQFQLVKENDQWKVLYINVSVSGVAEEQKQPLPDQTESERQPEMEKPPQQEAAQPQGPLTISDVKVEKQARTDVIDITIRFRVTNFQTDKSAGTARIHMIQDLKTFGPDGNVIPDLSRDAIKELDEGGQYQDYTHADFVNTLTIGTSFPQGTYKATLIVHDQIGGQTTESFAEFTIP